jgi:pimeloyl-ACP methyl ester carboxylesterase
MPATRERTLRLAGGSLELLAIPAANAGAPTLVLLHEGLGSVGLWREFPSALATATGGRTIVFSRYGHGQSDSPPVPRTPRFMHEEALDVLPVVLREMGAEDPVVVGHSDGASIALIYAAEHRPRAVVAMAPHVFVEEMCLNEIRRAREAYVDEGLRERMARHHRNPDAAFYGWNDVWLDPGFRAWDITDSVARVQCPLLLIQGERDQYGTLAQLDAIERLARGPVRRVHLNCQHAPHLEQPEETLEQIRRFLLELPALT